jgi:hypothetical protein
MRTARVTALHLASISSRCMAVRASAIASAQPSKSIETSWCGVAASTPVSTPTRR